MKKTFYSNGKLLLTAEYMVLDGATALALPTIYGQRLTVMPGTGNTIYWKSYDNDGSVWYEDGIPFKAIAENRQDSNKPETNTLIKILHEALRQNPKAFEGAEGYSVITELTFPREWGLGTSSTLINNIAQWLNTDAYTLLRNSFGGSGYDIACAQNNTPVLYQIEDGRPKVQAITFNPLFTDKLWFVYLNKKQNSRTAIAAYREMQGRIADAIGTINHITKELMAATSVSRFAALLEEHETVMSAILGQPTVKEKLFPDFNGSLKSLGAWGGDFILAIAEENPSGYFKQKGYPVIIPYAKMIK